MRQEIGQYPFCPFSACRNGDDPDLRRKLHQRLSTHAARRRWLPRVSRHHDQVKLSMAGSDRCRQCTTLGARSGRKRGVFDVASGDNCTVGGANSCADAKMGVWRIRVTHRRQRSSADFGNSISRWRQIISRRNDVPRPRNEIPNHSAIVAPRSENVARWPRSTALTPRPPPVTSRGTHSRA